MSWSIATCSDRHTEVTRIHCHHVHALPVLGQQAHAVVTEPVHEGLLDVDAYLLVRFPEGTLDQPVPFDPSLRGEHGEEQEAAQDSEGRGNDVEQPRSMVSGVGD